MKFLYLFVCCQGGQWLCPSATVSSVQRLDKSQQPLPVSLQLRLRCKMPDWNNLEKPSNLKHLDPKAFQYFYRQVRHDFMKGEVCKNKKEHRKDQKWDIPIFTPGSNKEGSNREEELKRSNANIMHLVAFIMAIEIKEDTFDKKEISKKYKDYIPQNCYNKFEKLFVSYMRSNLENVVEKLTKCFADVMCLKDGFLKHTEKLFPAYFCESYPARYDECGRVGEVRLVCLPPREDKPVSLVMVRQGDTDTFTEIASIDQICNIAVQDGRNIEMSRKNGVPLYFTLLSETDQNSLLSLLCAYYRLTEKWTFSLSTEISFPMLERLSGNKVHGPITEEFAEEKLKRNGYAKGLFLIRQCVHDHRKLYLHFCPATDKKSVQVLIVEEESKYRLHPSHAQQLPESLRTMFGSVAELVRALRNTPSFIEVTTPLHPSEFDLTPTLQLCRTDTQWKEDTMGAKTEFGKEKIVIDPRALSRVEHSLRRGRMCSVWRGEWRMSKKESNKVVAIKQLYKSLKDTHLTRFLEMSDKTLKWDDGSLVNIFGFCLPSGNEPPSLITEYFECGPLNTYIRANRTRLQNVDLVEAAACLARALHYLSDNKIVHGEIRARNVFVCKHTAAQFQVKLCEGSLDGPRSEDVHWLDFTQLRAAVTSEVLGTEVAASLAGDVWSFGTTLWELFSFGEAPLPGVAWIEAAHKYLNGNRLKTPQLLTSGQLAQMANIIRSCWEPDTSARKHPQFLMRDINQLLFKVFNSRRVPEYVTIDPAPPSPATLGPGSLDSRAVSYSSHSSFSVDTLPTPPAATCGLVPMFTDVSRKLLDHHNLRSSEFGSTSPLLPPGSSRSNSIFGPDGSVVTCQTSLYSSTNIYSMSSIYYLDDSSVDYNKEFPLGEGNFGVVYKGVRNKSDGDWEEVAIKEIKDTDSMSAQAHDDMDREVRLMKNLSHDNIVKIRGVITSDDNTIIVMEFIREGSLDRYLQVNRHNIDYPKQLFGYAQNIADGMEYLTQHKIIHRDLAARNILVADQENVKISDFGLARVATNDCYVMHSSSNIPVRWEALECLTHRTYSHKSDVWSFGVTLWEMFSFGDTPTLKGCEDFFTCSQRQAQDFRVGFGSKLFLQLRFVDFPIIHNTIPGLDGKAGGGCPAASDGAVHQFSVQSGKFMIYNFTLYKITSFKRNISRSCSPAG